MDEETRAALLRQHAMFHLSCVGISRLIRADVNPLIERAPKMNLLDQTVHGQYLRCVGWSFSVERLDDVFDNQAHSAACRALFEIVTDLALLTRGVEPIEKFVEWERVVRFREAERAVKEPSTEPVIRAAASSHVSAYAASIGAAMAKHWPKHLKQGRDPMRWTGGSLPSDAQRADKACPLGLGDFARDQYRRMCWGTHGSGLVLERGIPAESVPGLSILALNGFSSMLRHAIRLILEHFKLFEATWTTRIEAARVSGVVEANRRAFDAIALAGEASLAAEQEES